MDTLRGFDDDGPESTIHEEPDLCVDDNTTCDIGTNEHRMHVRAYNYWVSLLQGRAYPSIADLDPDNIADFGPHSVLLDFTGGIEDPAIQFLGAKLREESELDSSITRIAQVPSRSLLSRLTDHYLQIIANRTPIGFEAEFVSRRGFNTVYRGILMPFSSDHEHIDFIYGVINWKELVDAETQASLTAEVAAAVQPGSAAPKAGPTWASGPSAQLDDNDPQGSMPDSASLADSDDYFAGGLPAHLARARQAAASVVVADTRSRFALYRALGAAHEFAAAAESNPADYTELLNAAGITRQARAPMTPVVKLVFGAAYDKKRLTEFAAVLAHARRCNVPAGALGDFLDMAEGGIKGIVAAERAQRRLPSLTVQVLSAAETLRGRPALAQVNVATDIGAGDYVVLVARNAGNGALDIIGSVAAADPLTARAMAKIAR